MVKNPHIKTEIEDQSPHNGTMLSCPLPNRTQLFNFDTADKYHQAHLDWSLEEVNFALGLWFAGCAVTEVIAGPLVDRCGPKVIITVAHVVAVITTLTLPVVARYSFHLFAISQLVNGCCNGVTVPSCQSLLTFWEPRTERGQLSTIFFSASAFSSVMSLLVTGVMLEYCPWECIFYMNGILSAFLIPVWIVFASDTPAENKYISIEEQDFLVKDGCQSVRSPIRLSDIPFRSMLTSLPVIAFIVANTGSIWEFTFFTTQVPQYLKYVFHQSVSANGLICLMPCVGSFILSHVFAWFYKLLLKMEWISTLTMKKSATTLALLCPAVVFAIIPFLGCNVSKTAVAFVFAYAPTGIRYMGAWNNGVDLAPRFAGTLMGLSGCVTYTVSTLVPYLTVIIVGKEVGSIEAWKKVYFLMAGLLMTTNAIFCFFGTDEIQPWNDPCGSSDEVIGQYSKLLKSKAEEEDGYGAKGNQK